MCIMAGNMISHVYAHTIWNETCMVIFSACAKWRVAAGGFPFQSKQSVKNHVHLYTQHVRMAGNKKPHVAYHKM